ncbi:cytochrome c biogenesis protein CcdA, partial [Neisseria sp. P0017.S001]
PNSVQSYFQNQSNKLSGGKIISVFIMGILSALIVGPCVAPPLAFALGYIGQTGDAVLGGLALYVLALGTGVPLIIIGTFGG